jgi:hypothetical protein
MLKTFYRPMILTRELLAAWESLDMVLPFDPILRF